MKCRQTPVLLCGVLLSATIAAAPARADSCFDQVVRPVIADTLGVKQKRVDPGASLRGLGARRGDGFEIAARLEQALGFELSGREVRRWETVEDVAYSACSGRRYR